MTRYFVAFGSGLFIGIFVGIIVLAYITSYARRRRPLWRRP